MLVCTHVFSQVADAYLAVVLGWHKYVGVSLDEYPALKAYIDRVTSQPFWKEAQAAMAAAPHPAQ